MRKDICNKKQGQATTKKKKAWAYWPEKNIVAIKISVSGWENRTCISKNNLLIGNDRDLSWEAAERG